MSSRPDDGIAHGLRLLPGTRFAADRDIDQYLRLPHVLPAVELRMAIERLAALDRAVVQDGAVNSLLFRKKVPGTPASPRTRR